MNRESEVNVDVVAQLVSFTCIGISTVTQRLMHAAVGEVTDDLELIAEESLALATVASARVLENALDSHPEIRNPVVRTVMQVPPHYFDYIVGEEMLFSADRPIPDGDDTYERMARKVAFYAAHLPPGQYPGSKRLKEKMTLWMGRISSPGLHEHPEARLERLDLVAALARHLKLIREFTRQVLQDRS